MAKDSDPLADAFGTKETGGLFSGLLAEESTFDRRMMWRLGSWGLTAVGAVVLAVMANRPSSAGAATRSRPPISRARPIGCRC